MVGGGNRREEGSFTVTNSNVFAALDTLRKKKKSDKEKGFSKGGKGSSKSDASGRSREVEEKKVFWSPAPLTAKSWADVEDEDDDDYYATTAPPQAIWGSSGLNKGGESDKHDAVEESESEDELLLDEDDDDVEEEHDHEPEVQEPPELVVEKPLEASEASKEPEKQLSKKERKKKELAELEALLADFGVNQPKEKTEDNSSDAKKEGHMIGEADKKKNNAPSESKTSAKKKKKDKASKEAATAAKESQIQPCSTNGQDEATGTNELDESAPAVDVKEKLKKVASTKKKKTNKEMDAAEKAAAQEAAARRAKLAAAKKKEKSHYNQQPIR